MKSFFGPGLRWVFVLMLLAGRSFSPAPAYAQSPSDASFLATLGELRDASFADKEAIVDRLGQSDHPSVRAVLTAFLEDRLFYRNSDNRIFLVKSVDGDPPTLDLIDPISLKPAGSASSDSLTKIIANNHLRRTLRLAVARFGLSSRDPSVRLAAARDIERDLDEENVALLRERSGVETDSAVKKEIATGLALVALNGTDTQARLQAIRTLDGNLREDVRNRLLLLLEKNPDGSFVETDAQVRQAAADAVKTIDQWRGFYSADPIVVFRAEPGLGAGSDCHRPGHYVRRGGGDQHGSRRTDDAGRIHDLCCPARHAPSHRTSRFLVAIPAAFLVAGADRRFD